MQLPSPGGGLMPDPLTSPIQNNKRQEIINLDWKFLRILVKGPGDMNFPPKLLRTDMENNYHTGST